MMETFSNGLTTEISSHCHSKNTPIDGTALASAYARFDYITVGIYSSNVTNYDCRLYNFL